MAEDDEIDILGDFSIENFLSKGDSVTYGNHLESQTTEILNCDYTIHPQWLLDKPSSNPACWYDNEPSDAFTSALSPEQPHFDLQEPVVTQVKDTENVISDESGWTHKEKNLLLRGIEIFGKSNVRLSQFIGSKTAAEVRYYLKNFYSNVRSVCEFNEVVVQDCCVMDGDYDLDAKMVVESEIPASIEEVIETVSTAKPTVHAVRKKFAAVRKKFEKSKNARFSPKFKTDVKIRNSIESTKKLPKFKFNGSNHKEIKRKQFSSGSNNAKSNAEIVTGHGLSVPVCDGEQIVKITKENPGVDSDSDVEIDVEDPEDSLTNRTPPQKQHPSKPKAPEPENIDEGDVLMLTNDEGESPHEDASNAFLSLNLSDLDEPLVEQLTSLEVPQREVVLDKNNVNELEKFIHGEFFEGRVAKTPLRYLKIRNHIINTWITSKPNYVTKTSIRQGLKNCGDVNCIGRIHQYLEQIGAINFGCSQTSYVRPLNEAFQTFSPQPKEKSKELHVKNVTEPIPRRNKKKFANDGEGGCTMRHDESGEVVHTTVVNEEPSAKKLHVKRPVIKLIYCRGFTKDQKQTFTVSLNLSALLLMDLHAHSSLTEVMGLIGGTWDGQKRSLFISDYEPCKNRASSSTHCDMCPVSQAKAADSILGRGLTIVGWFHSHPTFAPEPSQQDLDTQLLLQQGLGLDAPCVGVILSPFVVKGSLLASPYRCLVVERKANFEDRFLPFKLDVGVVANGFDVGTFLHGARKVFGAHAGKGERFAEFGTQLCFQEHTVTYFDKMLSSIKVHLAKCEDLNKMTCDELVEGLKSICDTRI